MSRLMLRPTSVGAAVLSFVVVTVAMLVVVLALTPADDHLPRIRRRSDASTDVHRDAAELRTDSLHLAHVQAGAHLDAGGMEASVRSHAQAIARAGWSKTAKNPSPALSTSRPQCRRNALRTAA